MFDKKVVVNREFSDFEISEEAREVLGITLSHEINRTDEKLIDLIETWGAERVGGKNTKLVIKRVPYFATDWEIDNRDGYEEIIYVLNGLIYHM